MSEQEFVDWCDEYTPAEWVKGEVVVMSPVNFNHVDMTAFLLGLTRIYVEHHDLGTVVGDRMQVRLANIVSRREPDVLFVSKSRAGIIRETYLDGPPDLVVEIVSPESAARDWRDKHAEYAKGGGRNTGSSTPRIASSRRPPLVATRSTRRSTRRTARSPRSSSRAFIFVPNGFGSQSCPRS